MTFLRNHREVIAAMDFFTVPTATFRIIYVLCFIVADEFDPLVSSERRHPLLDFGNERR